MEAVCCRAAPALCLIALLTLDGTKVRSVGLTYGGWRCCEEWLNVYKGGPVTVGQCPAQLPSQREEGESRSQGEHTARRGEWVTSVSPYFDGSESNRLTFVSSPPLKPSAPLSPSFIHSYNILYPDLVPTPATPSRRDALPLPPSFVCPPIHPSVRAHRCAPPLTSH